MLVAQLVPMEETVTELLERSLSRVTYNVSESNYCPQEELIRQVRENSVNRPTFACLVNNCCQEILFVMHVSSGR